MPRYLDHSSSLPFSIAQLGAPSRGLVLGIIMFREWYRSLTFSPSSQGRRFQVYRRSSTTHHLRPITRHARPVSESDALKLLGGRFGRSLSFCVPACSPKMQEESARHNRRRQNGSTPSRATNSIVNLVNTADEQCTCGNQVKSRR